MASYKASRRKVIKKYYFISSGQGSDKAIVIGVTKSGLPWCMRPEGKRAEAKELFRTAPLE